MLSEIYRKLHANRWEHISQARRAREMQVALSQIKTLCETCLFKGDNTDAILRITTETLSKVKNPIDNI
jgi:DNA-binding transcriptional MerR regulator